MTFDTILVFCFGRFSTEPTTLLRIIGTPFANALNATFPTAKLPFSLAFVPLLPTLSPPLMHALFIVTRDHFSPTTGHSQQTLPLQFLVALVEWVDMASLAHPLMWPYPLLDQPLVVPRCIIRPMELQCWFSRCAIYRQICIIYSCILVHTSPSHFCFPFIHLFFFPKPFYTMLLLLHSF